MTTSRIASIPELLASHDIDAADLDAVREMGVALKSHRSAMIDDFYAWLENEPEFDEFFRDDNHVKRVHGLQGRYWDQFFEADVAQAYVDSRMRVGKVHAHIGLPLPSYFVAMNKFLSLLTRYVEAKGGDAALERTIRSVTKLLHLDTMLVVESFSVVTAEIIAEQHNALAEMSTPVTSIWDDILMLPIVGIIDSKRAEDVMTAVLTKIAETRARVFILDISGVAVVDTAVANHLIKVTKATKLMGCESVISGLSPAIAQTIVDLGIDTGTVETTSTLRDALVLGFNRIGVVIGQAKPRMA